MVCGVLAPQTIQDSRQERTYDRGVVDDRAAGLAFGECADDFDRVRPGYPDALVDDVLAYRASTRGPALEVGAGTGKATLAFAARVRPVVAIEPDPLMADVLARRLDGRTDGVRIVRSTFEAYRPEESFGLLYSADAWHWIRPDVRWELAARALVGGGTLALFWNRMRIDDPARRQAMIGVLAEITPTIEVHDEPLEPARPLAEWPGDELAARPEFTGVVGRTYPSRAVWSGPDYLTHMWTRSQIRMLTDPVRARLHAALADVFADPVDLAVQSVLYLARRAPS
jgi:SAM-dependent methyltransferase